MLGEIQVFFTDTGSLLDERLQNLFEGLPTAQKNKALKIKNKKKRREFIVGRILLIQAFFSSENSSKKQWQRLPPILEQTSKAPVIYGVDNCYVSISHSGDLVCCVLHEYSIGIDIEYKKSRKNLVAKSDFFMTHQEMTKLKEIEQDDQQLDYFYEIWCVKEALFKALDDVTQKQTSLKSIQISRCLKEQWSLCQKDIDDYHLSLVYQGGVRLVQFTLVDLEQSLIDKDCRLTSLRGSTS